MIDDHNYGASDYVAIGAKLVVPEQFTYYWDNIPNVQFATAKQALPLPILPKKTELIRHLPARPNHLPTKTRTSRSVVSGTRSTLTAQIGCISPSPQLVPVLMTRWVSLRQMRGARGFIHGIMNKRLWCSGWLLLELMGCRGGICMFGLFTFSGDVTNR